MDVGGTIIDGVHRRQPYAVPTPKNPYYLDTPLGRCFWFDNSGDFRFAIDANLSHADALNTPTTGEFSTYGRYFHAANGAAYNTLLRANLTASPNSQWGAEADGTGTSVVGYIRSTATARASAPAQSLGFTAGSTHSLGLTSKAGDQVKTYIDATLARYGTAATHYFDPAAGYLQVGAGVRGGIFLALAWGRVISSDEMAALDENPWQIGLAERGTYFSLPGEGGEDPDESLTVSISADLEPSANGNPVIPLLLSQAAELSPGAESSPAAPLVLGALADMPLSCWTSATSPVLCSPAGTADPGASFAAVCPVAARMDASLSPAALGNPFAPVTLLALAEQGPGALASPLCPLDLSVLAALSTALSVRVEGVVILRVIPAGRTDLAAVVYDPGGVPLDAVALRGDIVVKASLA